LQWDRVFWSAVLFVSFHHCSIFIFIYMLPLPEGQRGEPWEPTKMVALSAIREKCTVRFFSAASV
jgi:hypothetical protein